MLSENYSAALALITALVSAVALLSRPATSLARATVCCLAGIAALVYLTWRAEQLEALLFEPVLRNLWLWIFALAELLCMGEFLVFMLLMSRTRDNETLAEKYESTLKGQPREGLPQVDVWIATYDEEWSILERTLVGALHIDYPREKLRICVLDDGRRAWLRERCRELGVEHITRSDNKGKKAGNHNHALQVTNAPYILSLDADFIPFPNILFRLLGFFEDSTIGIVQTPQTFYNTDIIRKSLALRLAPDELAFFYREIQPARDAWDVAFYCGSCAVLRRSALLAIGGFVTETDIEDQATSVKLLASGYKTRFLNETLSVGLSAQTHAVFHDQRNRWCRGSLQLLFTSFGPLGRGLGLMQRLFFLQTPWVVWSFTPLVFYVTPALLWLFGWSLYFQARPEDVLAVPLLLFTTIGVALSWLSRLHWVPILSPASQLFIAVELAPTAVMSLLKPFGKSLIKIMPVTPKGSSATSERVDLRTFCALFCLGLGTLGCFLYGAITDNGPAHHLLVMVAVSFWTIYSLLVITIAILICFEPPSDQSDERVRVIRSVSVALSDGHRECGVALDVSLDGARVRFGEGAKLRIGQRVWLDFPRIGRIAARIVGQEPNNEYVLEFVWLERPIRHALIRTLFTDPEVQSAAVEFKGKPIFIDLIKRYVGLTE